MQHDPFDPAFIVDVTSVWERKMESLAAYRSQLFQPGEAAGETSGKDKEPQTKVASREFRLAIEGRARHYGLMIGAEFGEVFWSRLPLAVGDLFAVLPGGLR
jgi:LmbE family N-acetylglucosaminyl deacetylase